MLPSSQLMERSAAPTPGVRVLLAAFCCLTAAAVVSLLVLSDQTDETFAWTIQPPATAAFLGSGYGAGFVLSVLSLRSADWAQVRVPYVTVLVFTWLTAVATFMHLDRMHVVAPGTGPVAEPAGWLWLAVYVVIPIGMAALLLRQRRMPPVPVPQPPAVPMPGWLATALAVQGVVLLAVGATLFVAPGSAERLWPWPLTPLTARVVAAWLVAFAVAAALSVRAGDLRRLRIATVAYTVFGILQLTTILRFRTEVDWSGGPGVAYVVGAIVVIATGTSGTALARRDARTPSAA